MVYGIHFSAELPDNNYSSSLYSRLHCADGVTNSSQGSLQWNTEQRNSSRCLLQLTCHPTTLGDETVAVGTWKFSCREACVSSLMMTAGVDSICRPLPLQQLPRRVPFASTGTGSMRCSNSHPAPCPIFSFAVYSVYSKTSTVQSSCCLRVVYGEFMSSRADNCTASRCDGFTRLSVSHPHDQQLS